LHIPQKTCPNESRLNYDCQPMLHCFPTEIANDSREHFIIGHSNPESYGVKIFLNIFSLNEDAMSSLPGNVKAYGYDSDANACFPSRKGVVAEPE